MDFFGGMDPYVEIITYKGRRFKSKVKKGSSPDFNETFHVPVDSLDDRVIIKMMEKDFLSSDFIGEQQFFVSQLVPLRDKPFKDWVALYQQQDVKKTAAVLIDCILLPSMEACKEYQHWCQLAAAGVSASTTFLEPALSKNNSKHQFNSNLKSSTVSLSTIMNAGSSVIGNGPNGSRGFQNNNNTNVAQYSFQKQPQNMLPIQDNQLNNPQFLQMQKPQQTRNSILNPQVAAALHQQFLTQQQNAQQRQSAANIGNYGQQLQVYSPSQVNGESQNNLMVNQRLLPQSNQGWRKSCKQNQDEQEEEWQIPTSALIVDSKPQSKPADNVSQQKLSNAEQYGTRNVVGLNLLSKPEHFASHFKDDGQVIVTESAKEEQELVDQIKFSSKAQPRNSKLSADGRKQKFRDYSSFSSKPGSDNSNASRFSKNIQFNEGNLSPVGGVVLPGGKIDIKVIQGKLYRDTELITKMDPFFKIIYNGKAMQTRTIHEGGKYPVWNQIITFNIDKNPADAGNLKASCLDEDVFGNDLVGEAVMSVSDLIDEQKSQPQLQWISLFYKAKLSAEILVETNYEPFQQPEPIQNWRPPPVHAQYEYESSPVHLASPNNLALPQSRGNSRGSRRGPRPLIKEHSEPLLFSPANQGNKQDQFLLGVPNHAQMIGSSIVSKSQAQFSKLQTTVGKEQDNFEGTLRQRISNAQLSKLNQAQKKVGVDNDHQDRIRELMKQKLNNQLRNQTSGATYETDMKSGQSSASKQSPIIQSAAKGIINQYNIYNSNVLQPSQTLSSQPSGGSYLAAGESGHNQGGNLNSPFLEAANSGLKGGSANKRKIFALKIVGFSSQDNNLLTTNANTINSQELNKIISYVSNGGGSSGMSGERGNGNQEPTYPTRIPFSGGVATTNFMQNLGGQLPIISEVSPRQLENGSLTIKRGSAAGSKVFPQLRDRENNW